MTSLSYTPVDSGALPSPQEDGPAQANDQRR
jgi:hypothetical protein